jgi:hypothetical protein
MVSELTSFAQIFPAVFWDEGYPKNWVCARTGRGIGLSGILEKKAGAGMRKNWKWRTVTFHATTGELNYYDGEGIDGAKLKGHGMVLGVEAVEDRQGKRSNRFDIKIDHVERDTIDLLEVCTTTPQEKEHWMVRYSR